MVSSGLFTKYRGSAEVLQKQSSENMKFPSLGLPVISDSLFFLHVIFKNKKSEEMVLMLMIALYFRSSV